jgi:hypothetical protein
MQTHGLVVIISRPMSLTQSVSATGSGGIAASD